MVDITKKFVDAIQTERKARKWTLRKVGAEIGTNPPTICHWESGKQAPTLNTINRIYNSGEFGKKVFCRWLESITRGVRA